MERNLEQTRGSPPRTQRVHDYADILERKPERALRQVTEMAEELEEAVSKLTILSDRFREGDWKDDLKTVLNAKRERPEINIAVCGATGAGKSSLLNALLGTNIVPTSGTGACTSVITRISYTKSRKARAEIHFLTEAEWRQELQLLLVEWSSHVAENMGIAVDPRDEDAKVAWAKVHAVYPDLKMEELDDMDVESFLDGHPAVTEKLGQIEKVEVDQSAELSDRITKFIESGTKSGAPAENVGREGHEFALWPLIREVRVSCNAKALSKGAVLVDLPGVADANAARNSIAKRYLKDADNIWILAPISRAVDDQTAKTLLGDVFKLQKSMAGEYDSQRITFVATKTDDISCREIIRSLKLRDNPTLREILSRLDPIEPPYKAALKEEAAIKKALQATRQKLQSAKRYQETMRKNLETMKQSTRSGSRPPGGVTGKRKMYGLADPGRASKRAKRAASDGGESDETSDTDDDSEISQDELDRFWEGESSARPSALEVATAKLQSKAQEVEKLEAQLKAQKETSKGIDKKLPPLRSRVYPVQIEKNTFCSLRRNEYSRNQLKKDFRAGLREHDDFITQKLLGDTFDPAQNIRDYSTIDLPVFTCSSRDYLRLTGQATGDGAAQCFSEEEDTGIPALQQWCQDLTLKPRRVIARDRLCRLQSLVDQVLLYIVHAQTQGHVAAADRKGLYQQWDSQGARAQMKLGITTRLNRRFRELTEGCAEDMKKCFKDGLEERCRLGVQNAKEKAEEIVQSTEKTHHSTYRATIRRYGAWRRDFNVELVDPFASSIARAFSTMFEADKFGPLEVAVNNCVAQLLFDFEQSTAETLKDGANIQIRASRHAMKPSLQRVMAAAKETMTAQRKEISHSLSPHIQEALREGYEKARLEKGRGCVARMKGIFKDAVTEKKETMFEDSANSILNGLEGTATAIGASLEDSLHKLARQVELTLAVVWEDVQGGEAEIALREEVKGVVSTVKDRVALWLETPDKEDSDFEMN